MNSASIDLNIPDPRNPDVSAHEYADRRLRGCYVTLAWDGQILTLHLPSPAHIRALGLLVQAAGEDLEAARVANPEYLPTPAEALRHPREWVDGMVEVRAGEPPF